MGSKKPPPKLPKGWRVDACELYDSYSYTGDAIESPRRPTVVVWKGKWRDHDWTRSYRKLVNKSGMMQWAESGGYEALPEEITTLEEALSYVMVLARMS